MGLRGPAPTPTGVLQMRGTYRADRHGDPSREPEIELVEQLPKPPGFLDRVGKMEWTRIGPELVKNKLLSIGDLAAFTTYCVNVSRVAACEKILQAKGLTYETAFGQVCQRPEVAMSRSCGVEVRKFAQEFGLTPSARRRVRVADEKPADQKPADGWGKVAAS